uniref:Uncharacterized protein n=1 Tax=Anopheles minimus TaxID=112268 RepID=A0A182WPH0_9DIPT
MVPVHGCNITTMHDGGSSGGFSSFSITGDLLPISGFSSSSSWKITGMPFERNDFRSSSVPCGLDEEEAIGNDGSDQHHHDDDNRWQHERDHIVVVRHWFWRGFLRFIRSMQWCVKPVTIIQRHQADILQAKLLAECLAYLRPDRAVLVEQDVAQCFNLLLRASQMLTVECRVEEGNLHLTGVMDRSDEVDLDVMRGSVPEHLGQTLNEASLHLSGHKLLLGNVERQLKQYAVVAFVVAIDYNHQRISRRQTFAIFGHLKRK